MPTPLLLRATTVVDVEAGALVPGVDVLVVDGHIATITPTGTTPPGDAEVVDAAGHFVVPGYVDMHAHPLGLPGASDALELMGAYGITGFRQMSGSPALLAARATGDLGLPADGPALVAMPGDLLTPVNAGTVEAAVATVREQHALGADFLKVASVTPAVLLAVLDEAARVGIPVAGHLPNGIDVREASRRGMRCIEHLGPGVGITAATSTDESAILAEAAAGAKSIRVPKLRLPGMARVMAKVIRRLVVNPVTANTATDVDVLARADATFDEQRALDVAAEFVAHETWQCPTLIRVRTQQLADDPVHTEDPALRYVDAGTLRTWRGSNARFAKVDAGARATYRRNYALQLRLTKLFEEAGVPLLAGTDACGAGWVVAGHALHQEFDEMAAAGLAPLTVLRSTTLGPARFLGTTDRQGSVAEGKQADLVVLGADPLASVDALHDVVGVVRAGRWRPRAELDAVKDRIAAARSLR
ncbi:amidohydrolase family protein [Curtobacterium sp. ZW137]|uniref:amidohydrolase family protein n=1 Tax=Curtobacterium sp. ZW137 TaxID=2485104 RepID=UPI000F4BA0D1|nr:amidohydrolase family protein [Curtobacterium sp. ZW137]ROP63625.1 imidazolonepropionase-like amidohydrolase [Curtobacterium sp. ZW137]